MNFPINELVRLPDDKELYIIKAVFKEGRILRVCNKSGTKHKIVKSSRVLKAEIGIPRLNNI